VTSSDAAGNTVESTATSTHTVDTAATAGTVSVDAITEDDVINASESGATITVTGSAAGGDIASGDTVTLEINGNPYTTTVGADGTWSVDVAGADLAADTEFDAVVTSSDAAGNTVESTATSTHTVDTAAQGRIDIDRITSDKVINSEESEEGNLVAITGYVGNDAQPGDTISVTLDGVLIGEGVVSEETNENGEFLYSVDVLGSDLASTTMASPEIVVTVSGEDEAGNAFSAQSTEIYKVDMFADVAVSLSEESGDSIINFDEMDNLVVSGFVEVGGDVTSITITDSNGGTITISGENVSVDDNGDFKVNTDVSTLSDGELSVVVNVTDGYGNSGSSYPEVIDKDTSADAGTISIDVITLDDVINAAEAESTITVTGSATGGDIVKGDSVTVEVNGTKYTTTVSTDGSWSVEVAGSDLAADTEFDAVVTSSDDVGNEVISSATSTYTVDTSADAPIISLEAADTSEDGVYNAEELGTDGTVTATITLPDDFDATRDTLTINGETHALTEAEITAGEVNVEISPEETITATITDAAGNTSGESSATALALDNAPVSVTTTSTLQLVTAVSTFAISSIASGFSNSEFDEGGWRGRSDEKNNDDDVYDEVVSWGNRGKYNKYDAAESSIVANEVGAAASDLGFGDGIVVASITHTNDRTTSYYDGQEVSDNLEETDFNVDVTLVIAGQEVTVQLSSALIVTETSNSSSNLDDSLTLETTSATVEVDGVTYTVYLDGFLVNGEVVTTVSTAEDEAVTFSVVAHVESSDITSSDDNVLTGVLTVDGGEDGFDHVESDTVTDENGTLVINTDGTYSFTPSESLLNSISITEVLTYTYTVVDTDGDSVENTLIINVYPDASTLGTVTVETVTLGTIEDGYDYSTTRDISRGTFDSEDGFGSGDDSITVSTGTTDIEGSTHIETYAGNDTITVADDIKGNVSIDMGDGDDTIIVGDTISQNAEIDMGAGHDTVTIAGDFSSSNSIKTDSGNDTVTVDGNVSGEIHMGEGDDYLSIGGTLSDTVDGGSSGTDYLYLASYSYNDYINNVDSIRTDYIEDFEFIMFSDGVVYNVEEDKQTTDEAILAVFSNGTANTESTLNANDLYTVTGTATGGYIAEGDKVELEINGTTYTTVVSAEGTWTVDIAKSDLDSDIDFDAVVSSLDSNGNVVLTQTSYTHSNTTDESNSSDDESTKFEEMAANLDDNIAWFESNTGIEDTSTDSVDQNDKYWNDSETGSHVIGTSNGDTIYGNGGDDHLVGNNSQDDLFGGEGSDWLEGGDGDDNLYGNEGGDLLDGGSGQDYIEGGAGNDILRGEDGDDTLLGGDGNDILLGGQGQDTLTGGDGCDLFILQDPSIGSIDTITDFNVNDDALDVSDLLSGDNIDLDDVDAVTAYLNANLTLDSNDDGSGSLTVKDENGADHDVATFGSDSTLDSGSTVTVIYNEQEYSINIDG
jgi:Ca2+-binding RTX toxin-like protein